MNKKKNISFFKSSNCQALGVVSGGGTTPTCLQADQWRRMGCCFVRRGIAEEMNWNEKTQIYFFVFLFISFDLVGCGASIRLRTGPLWRSGRIATTIDVEQPITGRFRIVAVGRPQTGQLDDPRTILHRSLPLPTRQHFRIPRTYLQILLLLLLLYFWLFSSFEKKKKNSWKN